MEGWIKLHRSIRDHYLFKSNRPKSYREAWEDVLFIVNYEPKKVLIRGQIYNCDRGQSLQSLQAWANEFHWSIHQVRTFFTLLENDKMMTTEGLQYTTRLTVCNYDKYQSNMADERHTKLNKNDTPMADERQADGNRTATEQDTTKEDKESKEVKNNKNIYYQIFDEFRKIYPGKKRGNETEFENLCKKHKDWQNIIKLLKPSIEFQVKEYNQNVAAGRWMPEWKNLQTWINQRCWEVSEGIQSEIKPKPKTYEELVNEDLRKEHAVSGL
jgi:hypothetical protein